MKKLLLVIPALFIAVLFFYGCQQEPNIVEPGRLNLVTITQTGQSSTPIFAGQNIEVGKVTLVDIDTDGDGYKDALQVKYEITLTPWVITEIHFAVSKSSDGIPQTKKGNLIPGQFAYKFENLGGLTEYTFVVPFTAFDFGCDPLDVLYAAAHCVVGIPDGAGGYIQTETGWGFGNRTSGNNWAMIFSFNINCDVNNPTPPAQKSETAWAYACNYAFCFLNIPNLNSNNWGWTNGPFTAGQYTFDLYAGAGQCDRSRGTLVGKVTVSYNGLTAQVTFNTCGNYTLDETHLYVGADQLYMKNGEPTVAPGKFPYKHSDLGGVKSDTYTITVSGSIYIAAHAKVLGPSEEPWVGCGTPECNN